LVNVSVEARNGRGCSPTNYGPALRESNIAIGNDRRFSEWVNVSQFLWCKEIWATFVELDFVRDLKLFLLKKCINKAGIESGWRWKYKDPKYALRARIVEMVNDDISCHGCDDV
jgi:hypothetical protein